jgi:hypothetical protein
MVGFALSRGTRTQTGLLILVHAKHIDHLVEAATVCGEILVGGLTHRLPQLHVGLIQLTVEAIRAAEIHRRETLVHRRRECIGEGVVHTFDVGRAVDKSLQRACESTLAGLCGRENKREEGSRGFERHKCKRAQRTVAEHIVDEKERERDDDEGGG